MHHLFSHPENRCPVMRAVSCGESWSYGEELNTIRNVNFFYTLAVPYMG